MAFFKAKPKYPGLRAAAGTVVVGMLLEVGGLLVRTIHEGFQGWSERRAIQRTARTRATAQSQYDRANV